MDLELDFDRLDPEIAALIPTLPQGLANLTQDSVVGLEAFGLLSES